MSEVNYELNPLPNGSFEVKAFVVDARGRRKYARRLRLESFDAAYSGPVLVLPPELSKDIARALVRARSTTPGVKEEDRLREENSLLRMAIEGPVDVAAIPRRLGGKA